MSSSWQRVAWIPAVFLCLITRPAESAGSFRCGNKLITDGDPAEKVLASCGRPSEKTSYTALRPPLVWVGNRPVRVLPGSPIEVLVETWTYNRGTREFIRYLKFRDGRLVHITAGNYGY